MNLNTSILSDDKNMADTEKTYLGVIFAHRPGFPEKPVADARKIISEVFKKLDIYLVSPGILHKNAPSKTSEYRTQLGAVSNYNEAKLCAELFKKHLPRLNGLVICLANFGDERAIADVVRHAGLDVPVLVHAFPDHEKKMGFGERKDAYCGKISVCSSLKQYGIPFTLTGSHVVDPGSEAFINELKDFLKACRIVKGLKNVRIGAIGARPADFVTVRYSERILEGAGSSVVTVDLSEMIGKASKLDPGYNKVKLWKEKFQNKIDCSAVPEAALGRLAALGTAFEEWIDENEIDAVAVQCWTALQEYYGVMPCSIMSLLSEQMLQAACEVDVCGALSLLVLNKASGRVSALADWNNNYGENQDKVVLFHCSNFPPSMLISPVMRSEAGAADAYGAECSYGICTGQLRPGPVTLLRVETDDSSGKMRGVLAEGELTEDALDTYGGYGVLSLRGLDSLMKHLCSEGFAHHVGFTKGHHAGPLEEALSMYLGWDIFNHKG